MKDKSTILEYLHPILEKSGLFLVDIEVSPDNVIDIYIDSLTGTNITACIEVSKTLEEKLDREAEDFELSVYSAGIGYPFKVLQQYEKNLGKKIEVKFTGGTKRSGTLKSYSTDGIVLVYEEKVTMEGKKKKVTVEKESFFPFSEITEARDVVTF